jgi:hypothetical protein
VTSRTANLRSSGKPRPDAVAAAMYNPTEDREFDLLIAVSLIAVVVVMVVLMP